MTMDTSFDDALRVLQGGRSMAMEALQQLPVTWYEVVKMSGNRAQRALLGTTRPRLVGLHVESGQLVVLKLDAIRCAWLKWTRKVQDVQQVFQLKRRMGHATLTQLTLQFFPQGGTDHFSDIFLFQEAAARKFVTQVSRFRVSSKVGADHNNDNNVNNDNNDNNGTAAYQFKNSQRRSDCRSDSAAELSTPSNHHSAPINPLFTPGGSRASPSPADSQMDYKARFHAKLQAKRAAAAAAAAGGGAESSVQVPTSTELADTAVQPAPAATAAAATASSSMDLMLMDDELLIEPAPPCTPPPLSALPPPPPQQRRRRRRCKWWMSMRSYSRATPNSPPPPPPLSTPLRPPHRPLCPCRTPLCRRPPAPTRLPPTPQHPRRPRGRRGWTRSTRSGCTTRDAPDSCGVAPDS